MKFIILTLLPTAVSSFAVLGSNGRTSLSLAAAAPAAVAGEAIAAAMAASKQYGPASPEARVAWDTVEEINASDNRYVTCVVLLLACLLSTTSDGNGNSPL
jgi:hypothetical protein